MRRRVLLFVCFGLLGAGAALYFSAAPLVKHQAQLAASGRGFELEIGRVSFGWGEVWLHDVGAKSAELSALDLRLQHIRVDFGGLKPKRVSVFGGQARVKGSTSELAEQLRAYRARRGGQGGNSTSGGIELLAEGLDLSWRIDAAQSADIWGIQYQRDGSNEVIRADRLTVRSQLPLEAEGLRVEVDRSSGERKLRLVSTDTLSTQINLDTEKAAAEPGIDGADTTEEAGAAKDKNAPASSPAAQMLEREAQQGSKRALQLMARIEALRAKLLEVFPEGTDFDLNGVQLSVVRGGEPLRLGPGRLQIARNKESFILEFMPGVAGQATPLSGKLVLPLVGDQVKLSLRGGPVSLGWLGVQEGEWGLSQVAGARISANMSLELFAGASKLKYDGELSVEDLAIEKKWLASQVVSGVQLQLRGRGELALDGSELQLIETEVQVGEVRASLSGEYRRLDKGYRISGKGSVPLASCQSLVDALPAGLAPLTQGMRALGTFAAEGELQFESTKPEDVRFKWALANECRITATSHEVAPSRFKRQFTLMVVGADGSLVPHVTGPGSANWVPRGSIAHHMETAVLMCEDGRFWRHRGFDEEAIRNSIKENVKQGRFVRGASTISMQLAKNLYLKREKTLSRKLQEAILTMLLEQELSKQELLELYFNVIEYAPGVYGIGPGASHYFNTHASQLSLGQSLYIGSILSNPKRQRFGANGVVAPGWLSYLRRLMRVGNRMRLISDAELEDGLREEVTFKQPYSPRLAPEGEALDDAAQDPLDGASPTPNPEYLNLGEGFLN